jgi:serine/threonine protein kinase
MLLDKDGHLKIIDYGISKLIQNKIILTKDSLLYLSPEQIIGKKCN